MYRISTSERAGCVIRSSALRIATIALIVAGTTACVSEPQDPSKPPVYVSSCGPCHDTGGGGAPRTGDKEEWAIRLAKGKEAVYQLAIVGFEAEIDEEGRTAVMPAKGARNDLSDDEIKGLVDYMIERSQ